MKRLYSAYLFLLFSILAFNCQKEVVPIDLGPDPDFPANTEPAPITATLQGNVFDKNGTPAVGVTVRVGTKSTQTDAYGYFRIKDAALDKGASLVTAEKAGYFKAYRTFSATSGVNNVAIKLIEKVIAGTINSTSGGNVTLSNGAKIALPANGVVKAAGGSYSGTINVYAAYIDPTGADISETVPGSFMANDKDGKRVMLASFGMLAVELESSSGEKLQIASNSKATLTSPIPSSLQSAAPATIPLWYVNEETGLWTEQGTAIKNGTNYIGDVSHFSFWNCDYPYPIVGITATITVGGDPLVHTVVRIRQVSPLTGAGYGYTDSAGQVSGAVPSNQNLVLEVLNQCNEVIYTQNIGPYTSSVDLGTISVPTGTVNVLTVKGKLLNCSNDPVTDGYALFRYDNMTRMAATDNNGEFSVSLTYCNSAATSIEILGIDESTLQQSTTLNIPTTTPITDVGNITVCGTSAAEFVNYTLDGTNYNITVGDSLMAYAENGSNDPAYTNFVSIMASEVVSNPGNWNYMQIRFNSNAVAGTYPIANIYFSNLNQTAVVSPSTVTLTSFPTTIGQFFEGSFTAQFTESGNPHNVSGSFRVRRTQ